jgi:hypothetical protein
MAKVWGAIDSPITADERAAIVHVLAVIAHRLFKKENLVAAMFTGKKAYHAVPASEAIRTSRTWLAVLIVFVLGGALAWVVGHAPIPSL